MFERIPLDDAVKKALDALGPVRLKGGNAYANIHPSQQKGTSGQRRVRRQQEAERMKPILEAQRIEDERLADDVKATVARVTEEMGQ